MAAGVKLKKGTLDSPGTNYAKIQYDTTLAKVVAVDQSGNQAVLGGFATKDYRLVRVLSYTTGNNTYTPTTGAKAAYVEAVGGGGGGGATIDGATNAAAGGGGGGGAYAAAWISGAAFTGNVSFAANVGGGGTGGTAGNNNATAGTDTSFTGNTDAVLYVNADGGALGVADTVGATVVRAGGAGGVGGLIAGCTGDIKLDGGAGAYGLCLAAAQALSGHGGSSYCGFGAISKNVPDAAGVAATAGSGGGGSGAIEVSGGTQNAGGNGGSGMIRIFEFA